LYLAVARPFKIGDAIKVFGQSGRVIDIGLLYTRLSLDTSQDQMLVPSSSMVTTWLVLVKGVASGATSIKTV
jgi:small-conductance mechanosensitive channel